MLCLSSAFSIPGKGHRSLFASRVHHGHPIATFRTGAQAVVLEVQAAMEGEEHDIVPATSFSGWLKLHEGLGMKDQLIQQSVDEP